MAKVMISLPGELLARVDAEARRESRSRSELVREALRRYLAGGTALARREAIERLRRSLGGGDWVAEKLVRAARDR